MTRKILLINGDKNVMEILKIYLEMKNYEVYQSSDGVDGLEQAKKVLPDLILLNVILQRLDGYEVCKKLKEEAATKDIPVLFLSSLMGTNEKIKGLESGGGDFINDAADYAEIFARIETHIKIKELRQELQIYNKELLAKQKMLDDDLKAAAFIQKSLLPTHKPQIPYLNVAWLCEPCSLVGGDICSIHKIHDELSAFYVLDVSGHGVSSAMVTVSITQYIRQRQHEQIFSASGMSPKQMLTELNRDYPYENFNSYSTIFYMIFNKQNDTLTYSSAGHPPGVLLSPTQGFRLLSTEGGLIGVDSKAIFSEKEEVLQKGDKVILYTDGITEFKNPNGELFGEERFYHLLEEIKHHPLEKIIELINQSLKEFGKGLPPTDDISILGVEYGYRD